jgi:hypothetical protein
MGLWDKVDSQELNGAESTQGGLYFKPGNFLVQVQRCKEFKDQQKHDIFIAEFKILDSDSDNPNLQVGAEPTFYVDMDGKWPKLALGNVADFMRAGLSSLAAQHEEDVPATIELTKEIGESVTGAENLLTGVLLQVNCYNKPTKAGGDFTMHKWRVPEKVAELAAGL